MLRSSCHYLLSVAGMPKAIIDTYRRYHEQLDVFNSLGLGLGTAYPCPNGIPQGCPISMMMVALLLRPWMTLMHTLNVVPRALADDLLLLAPAPSTLSRSFPPLTTRMISLTPWELSSPQRKAFFLPRPLRLAKR